MIDTTNSGLPVAANEDAWKRMSDQDRARLIAAWNDFWLRPGNAPATSSMSVNFAPIVLEPAVADENPTDNWRGPEPTAAERASLRDWNKS